MRCKEKELIGDDREKRKDASLSVIRINFGISCAMNILLIFGAYVSNSYTILSECLHMLIDTFTYFASWISEFLKIRSSNPKTTSLIDRISGLSSILLLLLSQSYIIYNSISRLYANGSIEVDGNMILVCGIASLFASGLMLLIIWVNRNEIFSKPEGDEHEHHIDGIHSSLKSENHADPAASPKQLPDTKLDIYEDDDESSRLINDERNINNNTTENMPISIHEVFNKELSSSDMSRSLTANSREGKFTSEKSALRASSVHEALQTSIDVFVKGTCSHQIDYSSNLNLSAAILHVLGDAFQAIGTCVVGILVKFATFSSPSKIDALCSLITCSISLTILLYVIAKNAKKGIPNNEHNVHK